MKTILYYIIQTIKHASTAIVLLTCILALGIGLKELIHEDWYGVAFWTACGVCIFIYGSKEMKKKNLQQKEENRWNDIENKIHQHYTKKNDKNHSN